MKRNKKAKTKGEQLQFCCQVKMEALNNIIWLADISVNLIYATIVRSIEPGYITTVRKRNSGM